MRGRQRRLRRPRLRRLRPSLPASPPRAALRSGPPSCRPAGAPRSGRAASGGTLVASSARRSGQPFALLLFCFQLVERRFLDDLVLLLREDSQRELSLRDQEPPARRLRAVELALGLGGELLGDPDRPADRRQRQRQQARDDAHQRRSSRLTKLCGGRGPTYEKSTRPACAAASSSIASSKVFMRFRSTRKDARRSWCSICSSETSYARAIAPSRSTMERASRAVLACSSAETSSPSSRRAGGEPPPCVCSRSRATRGLSRTISASTASSR